MEKVRENMYRHVFSSDEVADLVMRVIGEIEPVGETVTPTEPFDDDRLKDCASGIHFFITRQEAVNY